MSVHKLQSSRSFQNLIDPILTRNNGFTTNRRLNNLSLSPLKNKQLSNSGSYTTNHHILANHAQPQNQTNRFQFINEKASSDTNRYLRLGSDRQRSKKFESEDRTEPRLPSLRTKPLQDPEAIKALLTVKKPRRREQKAYGSHANSSSALKNNISNDFRQHPLHYQQQQWQQQQHYMHQQYQDALLQSQQQSAMNQLLLKTIERVAHRNENSDDEEETFMKNHKMIRALDKQSAVLQRIALDLKAESDSRANQEVLTLMHKLDKAELKKHMQRGQKTFAKVSTLNPSDPFDPETIGASEEVSEDEENEKETIQQLYNTLKKERSKAAESKIKIQSKRPSFRGKLKTPVKSDRLRTESHMQDFFQPNNYPVLYNQPSYFQQPQISLHQASIPQQTFQMGGMYGFPQFGSLYQQTPYEFHSPPLQPQFNRLPFDYLKVPNLPGFPEIRLPDWNGTHQFPSLEQQYLYNSSNVRIIYRDANEEKKMKEDELLKAQMAKESSKKRKKHGKAVLKKKLKTHLWLICYSSLLKREAERKIGVRKQNIQLSINSKQQVALASAQAFILKSCSKALDEIYKEKKAMIITGDEKGLFGSKAVSEKEADTRIRELIFPKLHMLLAGLVASTKAGIFPSDLALFLASISEDQCVPPNNFYLSLELDRLAFTHLGTLKSMTEAHAKMVLAFFMVVRVLVYQFLLEPWSQISSLKSSIPKSDTIRKGLKTLGSILTILIEDNIKNLVKIQNGNQNHLSPEAKVKPIASGAILYSDKENEKIAPKSVITDRAIAGTYTKDDLGFFFRNKKQEIEQLNSLLIAWVSGIYNLTHQAFVEKRQIIITNGNS